MAEVNRYIDPDVSGGAGDGTSWSDAYSSLSAWEAAEQTNLVTDGDYHIANCRASSGTADTTSVTINGWTTGASNYIEIKAASTDRAVSSSWDATKYRLDVAAGDAIYNLEDYVRFDGLQLEAADQAILLAMTAGEIRISNCRIQDSNYGVYLSQASDSPDSKIWNCIIDTMGTDGIYYRTDAGTMDVYNCVVYGCTDDGIQRVSGNINVVNCAVFTNGDDFIGTFSSIDYCASDDGDGTNAVSPSGGDWDNEYTDSANGDFSLVSGGNCEGGGTDNPGSGLYSTDIEGDSYTSTWSIGCDAKTVSGAAPTGNISGPLGGPLIGAL